LAIDLFTLRWRAVKGDTARDFVQVPHSTLEARALSTYRIGTVHIPAPVDAVGTPIDSPTSGLPPSRFTDGEVLTLQYATDPAAIRALLPEPLEPINDTVQIQVSRWGSIPGTGRNIHECNVMVAARYGEGSSRIDGSYSPYFWVESDRSMVGGREFHGQPKRIADISLETIGDLHVGRVRHNGIDVFTGTMQYKPQKSTFERLRSRIDPVTNMNLKIVNHIDSTPAIKQLTARDLTDIEVFECYEGPCTVDVRPTATAPLYRLPPLEFLEGFYWRTDFSLVGGYVVHDYLAEPRAEIGLRANARAFSSM
jgi:acetoacetate decarboxylase